MDGLEGSMVMAQAALGVKNAAIDMLCEELQGLRRENDDLFRVIMQVPRGSNSVPVAAAAADAPQTSPPTSLPAQAEAQIAALQAAAAEAAASKQQLQQVQQQQAARDAELQQLRAELAESRQHIKALEAELQDTMDAAMQLWDTVQAGTFSEGSASRPGSLYQEQLSPLSPLLATQSDAADAADIEQDGQAWRTPSASPVDVDEPSPRSQAAAAAAADVTPRRTNRATTAAAAVGGEGEGHPGFFTPIELRVHSLASKLRTYMMRQPGMDPSASPLTGRSAASMHSPHRGKTAGSSGSLAAAAAAVDADVSAARDDQA